MSNTTVINPNSVHKSKKATLWNIFRSFLNTLPIYAIPVDAQIRLANPPKAKADGGIWPFLGMLRFLLAGIVAFGHAPGFLPPHQSPNVLDSFNVFDGKAAVVCFFVISGYCMSHSITTKPEGFIARRWQRVYPLYVTGIILAGIVYAHLGVMLNMPGGGNNYEAPTLLQFLSSFVFLQNFYTRPDYGLWANAPLWSLCVECFFYALCPIFQKINTKSLTMIVVLSIGAYLTQSVIKLPMVTLWAWPFLMGFLYYRVSATRWANGLLGLGAPIIFLIAPGDPGKSGGWLYLICLYIIMIGHMPGRMPSWIAKTMLWVGEISFPLYICHYPLYWIMGCVWHVKIDWGFPLAALGLAIGLFYTIDLPSRWYFKRQKVANNLKYQSLPGYRHQSENMAVKVPLETI